MITPAPTTATASGSAAVQDRRQHEQQQHPEADGQRGQRGEPAPAAEDQHRGGEQRREPEQRAAALEVDDLVGAGVVGVAARPAEHHGVADGEARRARLDRHELDQVAARRAARRSSRRRARRTAPARRPGSSRWPATAVTWPRTGCSSAVPAAAAGAAGGAEQDQADQGGERHRARAARRAAPGPDGLPAGRRVPVPVAASDPGDPCPACASACPDPGSAGLAVRRVESGSMPGIRTMAGRVGDGSGPTASVGRLVWTRTRSTAVPSPDRTARPRSAAGRVTRLILPAPRRASAVARRPGGRIGALRRPHAPAPRPGSIVGARSGPRARCARQRLSARSATAAGSPVRLDPHARLVVGEGLERVELAAQQRGGMYS